MTWESTPFDWLPTMSLAEAYWLAFGLPAIIIGTIVSCFAIREVIIHWGSDDEISFGLAWANAIETVVLTLMAVCVGLVGIILAFVPSAPSQDARDRADLIVILLLSVDFGILIKMVVKVWVIWFVRHWNVRLRLMRSQHPLGHSIEVGESHGGT